MNWVVLESNDVAKTLDRVPRHIKAKYLYWKRRIKGNGIDDLARIRGFNFEKLKGTRTDQYSCRLSRGYRVIFEINDKELFVLVLEINKHEY
jgi:mRNA-degrading endonuclease RelE of RelBE toxin-antitoxin system